MKKIKTIIFEEYQDLEIMKGVQTTFDKIVEKRILKDKVYFLYNNDKYMCSILNHELINLNVNKNTNIEGKDNWILREIKK